MLRTLLDRAADLLWPPRCAACDRFVGPATVFCEGCAQACVDVPARTCPRCAMPSNGSVCDLCAARPPPYAGACASAVYGGSVTDALLRFKHGRRRDLARPLGQLLRPAASMALGQGVDVVVPVPLHPQRLRDRGFNQSLALARTTLRGIRHPPRILPDVLRRVRDTPGLGHESPRERRLRLEGAFAVFSPRLVTGRHVLLVDDVMTTGATLAGCSTTLLDAGAVSVRVAIVARAI